MRGPVSDIVCPPVRDDQSVQTEPLTRRRDARSDDRHTVIVGQEVES